MFKSVIIPILIAVLAIFSLLACIAEKHFQSKVLYAVLTIGNLILLVISANM